ncbi:hypothetical protein [Actinacidiphila yeochonensis]|uniref:hypothetical protein n=1 Tax=Actinacidiphila yeochonensis TaxID=89050 RepID=UPI000A7921BD|nr:hypothetical protein [Actinacidiphila yeochonensis]
MGHGTPAAPTGGAAAPQGGTGTPVELPQWSAYRDAPAAGVRLTGGPRALTVGHSTYVFARGADKNVWYVVYDGSGYGSWHRLTGISTEGDPAVVSAAPGRIDLFSVGTDGLLYHRTLTSGYWQQWVQVDQRTRFDAAPAAASSEPGRIDLVGRVGGDLVTASLVDGRWNAWALVPTAGRITAAPALVSRAHGALDAFVVRRADGAVLRLPFSGGAWRPSSVVDGLDGTAAGRRAGGRRRWRTAAGCTSSPARPSRRPTVPPGRWRCPPGRPGRWGRRRPAARWRSSRSPRTGGWPARRRRCSGFQRNRSCGGPRPDPAAGQGASGGSGRNSGRFRGCGSVLRSGRLRAAAQAGTGAATVRQRPWTEGRRRHGEPYDRKPPFTRPAGTLDPWQSSTYPKN